MAAKKAAAKRPAKEADAKPSTGNSVRVRLLSSSRVHKAGDVVEVAPADADRLVSLRVAVRAD